MTQDRVILPCNVFFGQTTLLTDLIKSGIDVNSIYLLRTDKKKQTIEPYLTSGYLPYLEFHIADHCNLNCAACEHYSGLVDQAIFPVYEKFVKDIHKLHDYVDSIGVIRILGGEPLLNVEVCKYLSLCRNVYPNSVIYLVTNGILINQMNEDFFSAVKLNNINIHVSYYPTIKNIIGSIKEKLELENVLFCISKPVTNFTIKQTLKKHDHAEDIFLQCFQAHCHNLYDGKIAACFLPFTTKYFNSYFNTDLPEDGWIDLYDQTLSVKKIKEKLLLPFSRCSYCTRPHQVIWSQMHTPGVLSDWVR